MLFGRARHGLSLPVAVLCMASALSGGSASLALAVLPVVLHIAALVYGLRLKRAYDKNGAHEKPAFWARRFTALSLIDGAIWGLGAVLWFDPNSFAAEAFLVLAFLAMSTTEFVARAPYRAAYLAHATLSLGPLAALLALQGGFYEVLSALLLVFAGLALFIHGGTLGVLFDEGILLRHDNTQLIARLNEEKRVAEATRDQAQAGERAKSAFISNISYELRTPLNAILGMAQLLERSELEKAQRDHVKVLLEAGRGLKTLLDDIIALASQTEETGVVPEEGCDAAQAARTVARLLQPNAWEKRLRLSVNIANGLPRVACDPRLIRRVLLKVAGNAIKFTERGNVEIALDEMLDAAGRQVVRFSVTDTGPGIPSHLLSAIFEPFAGLGTNQPAGPRGAGVSLAVAKRLVESAGGGMGVESEPSMGATFWITMPATQAPVLEQADSGETAVSPPVGLLLLVLARDPAMRAAINRMLAPFGNRITFAENLGQASTIAARNAFDAILSTASQVDSLAATPSQRTPILALVAWDERPPVGANHVLRWPANADALYTALATTIGDDRTKALSHGDEEPVEESLDARAIRALEKSLGLTTLLDILQSYLETAHTLASSVSTAAERADWAHAGRLAQDFAGAAGGLGLPGITSASRTLAQAARDGASPDVLAKATDVVLYEHRRVAEALRRLYPDLSTQPAPADAA